MASTAGRRLNRGRLFRQGCRQRLSNQPYPKVACSLQMKANIRVRPEGLTLRSRVGRPLKFESDREISNSIFRPERFGKRSNETKICSRLLPFKRDLSFAMIRFDMNGSRGKETRGAEKLREPKPMCVSCQHRTLTDYKRNQPAASPSTFGEASRAATRLRVPSLCHTDQKSAQCGEVDDETSSATGRTRTVKKHAAGCMD